jgi:hypothetical protein
MMRNFLIGLVGCVFLSTQAEAAASEKLPAKLYCERTEIIYVSDSGNIDAVKDLTGHPYIYITLVDTEAGDISTFIKAKDKQPVSYGTDKFSADRSELGDSGRLILYREDVTYEIYPRVDKITIARTSMFPNPQLSVGLCKPVS